MPHSKWLSLPFVAALGVGLLAQQPKTFKARLSPVPIDIAMQANIAGSGSVSAVLTGTKLAVTGTFEGLRGPATTAQVHKSPTRGMRGPVVVGPRRREGHRADRRHHHRHPRPDAGARHRPRKGAALRAASQRESPRRQLVGLDSSPGEPPMNRPPLVLVALAIAAAMGIALLAGQPAQTGVFTAEQAAAGRAAYQTTCAGCHMPDLGGRNEAPQLAGSNFMSTWRTRSTARSAGVHAEHDAAVRREPPGRAVSEHHLLHPAVERRRGRRAAVHAGDGRADWQRGDRSRTGRECGAATGRARRGSGTAFAGRPRRPWTAGRRSAAAAAARRRTPGRSASRSPGTVKNYTDVTDEMLRNPDPGDWLMARRNYQGWSHTPLTQITRDNVKELQLAWVWAMNESGAANEPTPIVHNGTMYLTNPGNILQALDARTGELIWEHRVGPERDGRHRRDAEHGDLSGQGVLRDHRRAADGARRAHRQEGVGHGDRRPHQGIRQHRRPDGGPRRGRQRPGRLRSLRQRRLLDQRLRRRHRQAAVEVQHGEARQRDRAARRGASSPTTSASAAKPGLPAATIRIST